MGESSNFNTDDRRDSNLRWLVLLLSCLSTVLLIIIKY